MQGKARDAINKRTCDLSDRVVAAKSSGEGNRDHEPWLWLAPTEIHTCNLKKIVEQLIQKHGEQGQGPRAELAVYVTKLSDCV